MHNTFFDLLRRFDNHFLINRLPYCIVGRTEHPGPHIERDIDIIIRQSDVGNIHAQILQFCKHYGLLLIQCVQHEYNGFCYVIAWLKEGNPQFLKLDICGDYHRRGRLFLLAEELLSGRIKTAVDCNSELKLFLAAPRAGFLYYFMKKIDQGMIDDDQGLYLHNQWKKDPAGCGRNVSRFWNEADRSLIARACQTNNWTPVRNAIPRLRGSLRRTVRVSWRRAWGELLLGARGVMRPTGLTVAFPGRESAVKSSVLARVETRIGPAFSRCVRYNLRPGFLCFHPTGDAKRDGADPKKKRQHGPIASAAKLICCWLYCTSRYAVAARWKKVYSTLILFDRYYVDMFAGEDWFRYVPLSIASFAGKCIPRPDLFVAIITSSDIDKWSEINAQNRYLLKERANVYYINDGENIDNISQAAITAILEYLTIRTYKQLNKISY